MRAIAVLSLFLAGLCLAAEPAPMVNPTGTASAPAAPVAGKPLAADPSIDQVLDALRDVGTNLKDFTAEVGLTETDAIAGTSTIRKGTVWYQLPKPGEARIRVDLPSKQVEDRIYKDERVEYMLKDGVLWDRDYKRKVQVERPVLKPGEKTDLFKLGAGPFPLPIGQDPAEVRKQFEIEKLKPAKDEPANSVHVKLTPKKDTELSRDFKSIDVWVDTQSSFPVRIDTVSANEGTLRTTELKLKGLNGGLGDREFTLEDVKDWNVRREPMRRS